MSSEGVEVEEGSKAEILKSKGRHLVPSGSKYRKFAKRETTRKWRRLGKKSGEDAPKKRPTAGWAD